MRPELPASGSYRLARARIHRSLSPSVQLEADEDGFCLADLEVREGMIADLGRHCEGSEIASVDLAGRVVLPCFVDCHTHIDKGHIWPRRRNLDGTFASALVQADADRRAHWSAEDVARRMDFSLRCAFVHGTAALRTHIDSLRPQEAISWPVFEAMRERWRGRIELQGAALIGIEDARDRAWFASLAARVAAAQGVLGAVATMVPDLDQLLDDFFATAARHRLDLDFHADETADPEAMGLRKIAQAAIRSRFQGKIMVGHCCSLAIQTDREVLETLDAVARAGISVVSLPMCNLYLQDRRAAGGTPRWRGVTLVHEMRARGIPVAVASDNTRDPFYPFGDLDMLEVYRMATRIMHLDHPIGGWPRMVAAGAADAIGLAAAGRLAKGGPADFIVFSARSFTELMSRPQSDRIVVRAGRAITSDLPDYSELDDLMVR